MTVSTPNNIEVYRGNGITVSWPWHFRIDSSSELSVAIQDYDTKEVLEILAPGSYTATGFGNDVGGAVIYPLSGDPLPDTRGIILLRTVPYTQDLDILPFGAFNPDVVERQLDRIVMQIQQLKEQTDRSVKVNIGDTPPSGSELIQLAEDVEAAKDIAVDAAQRAEDAANMAITQGNVPIRESRTLAATFPVPDDQNKLLVFGNDGGVFTDTITGTPDFSTPAGTGALARPWQLEPDINKKRLADDMVRYIERPILTKKEKWIISSDWQPVNTEPTQIAYLRTVMDSFKTYHSDADYIICPGDLVDAASANNTGAAPTYGYPQLRADFESRTHLSWERFIALPGNHDRDGIPAGTFERFWSYQTYREQIGPEFYSMIRGNMALLFLGDMAGSNSGEVLAHALEWLERELALLKGYNIIIFFHQPLYGVHPTGTSETSTWVQYNGGTRIAPILDKYKSQIVFCGYGHVGRSYATGTTVTDLNGIRWINFSLAIPGLFNSGWVDHGVYSTLELTDKATSLTLKRWDVENAAYNPAYDVALTLPFPLSLGNNFWSFDGRKHVRPQNAVFRNRMDVYASQSEFREDVGGTWGAKPTTTDLLRLILADDSAEAVKTGTGAALLLTVPGVSTKTDADGAPVSASPRGWAEGVRIAAVNTQNGADIHEARCSVQVSNSSDVMEEVLDIGPSTYTGKTGLNMKANFPIRMVDNIVVDTNRLLNMTPQTVAQLNALSLTEVKIAYCSNGNAGAPCLAVSKGAGGGWARIALGTNISAT